MQYLPTIRKAIAAVVFGALGALGTAMLDGVLTPAEAIAAGGAGLVAGAAVWTIRNHDEADRVPLPAIARPALTFVVGAYSTVIEYARANGLTPATAELITSPAASYGLKLRDDDAVVVLDPDMETLAAWRVVEHASGRAS